MIKEHNKFQLEAEKLGRHVIFQVTVFEKHDMRRKKLFAETQCSDPIHFIIQFIIREASTFEELLDRFINQLEHRGFDPLRYRVQEGGSKWSEWEEIEHEDVSEASTK